MGESATELRRDIEDTRVDLTRDVDAIGDRISPRRMAQRRVNRTRDWMSQTRDRVFGSIGDATSSATGRMGDATSRVSDAGSTVGSTIASAPQVARRQTRGNPMVAGAVAFGAGFLAAVIFGPTETEEQAVRAVGERAGDGFEPVKQGLSEAAQEVTSTVKEAGSQAAQELKQEATVRAQDVKETARDASQDVRQAASESRPSGS